MPDTFLTLICLTAFTIVLSIVIGYRRSRDPFHPMVYIGLMLLYFYCYMPIRLFTQDPQGLFRFLSINQLIFIQGLNLAGVLALAAGILAGSGNIRYVRQPGILPGLGVTAVRRIQTASILIGLIGVSAYAYGLISIGGFGAAYGKGYGGGWSDSGWVREAIFLTIPALLWLMMSKANRKLSAGDLVLIGLFISPLMIQGLLGSRRGPTAMAVVVLLFGWMMIRRKRPALMAVVMGAALLGSLMIFLVVNRSNIYLGSDRQLDYESVGSFGSTAGEGNEYIYGGGAMVLAHKEDRYYWGKRYLTIFFVRPIPKEIWPDKYEESSQMLGIPNIEKNLGVGTDEFEDVLGWPGARGAAPGIISDMWVEFSWYFVAPLFFIGYFYGRAWRHALAKGGRWIPNYVLMTSLSIYLIAQTFEAMAFRYLIAAAGSWIVWKYGMNGSALGSIRPTATRSGEGY
jgi:hypothetical protein